MKIDEKPALFAAAAAAVISVGTLVTTFIPLFFPSTQPTSPYVRPYTAVEIEGRDIYLREGCNNCHTQTVRPLRAEVARFGEYSRPEESAYDRPFLWGSRRTGPDLARIGGKYPDAWHYRHLASPQAMFGTSNMPPFRWLAERRLDTGRTARKARVLGYGYDAAEVAAQVDAARRNLVSAAGPSAAARSEVTPVPLRGDITEMDALVAYLQKVGRDLRELRAKEAVKPGAAAAAETRNPFAGNRDAEKEGEKLFETNCKGCHGEKGVGGFGPNLTGPRKYGGRDADLFATIAKGRPGGMPSWEGTLGRERIWKAISYLRTLERR